MNLNRRAVLAAPLLLAARPAFRPAPLEDAVAAIGAQGVRIGMVVRARGRSLFAVRGDERFAMCSTFKLPLAAMTLSRADGGAARVPVSKADVVPPAGFVETRVGGTASLAELARATAVLSDNGAANLLLRALGGPAAFTAWLRRQGDAVTRLDRWEPDMSEAAPGDPRDTTSPAAFAALFERLLGARGVTPQVAATLRGLMLDTRTGETMLRPGLPPGWREGHKTGAGSHGTRNIVSVVTPPRGAELMVAIFTTQGPERLEDRNALFPPLARALVRAVA